MAESSTSRVASAEVQGSPPTFNPNQPEHERLVLFLAVDDEVRSVADLNGKAIALGEQEPAIEKSIKQAFAAARVAPNFVGDARTDAIGRLIDREVAAAPLMIGPATTELPELTATLSDLSLWLLEVPLDPQSPQ